MKELTKRQLLQAYYQFQQEADDTESEHLDNLVEKMGLTWQCECGFRNCIDDRVCQDCRKRPYSGVFGYEDEDGEQHELRKFKNVVAANRRDLLTKLTDDYFDERLYAASCKPYYRLTKED